MDWLRTGAPGLAQEVDDKDTWHRLGVEALRQGNHQIMEFSYQARTWLLRRLTSGGALRQYRVYKAHVRSRSGRRLCGPEFCSFMVASLTASSTLALVSD